MSRVKAIVREDREPNEEILDFVEEHAEKLGIDKLYLVFADNAQEVIDWMIRFSSKEWRKALENPTIQTAISHQALTSSSWYLPPDVCRDRGYPPTIIVNPSKLDESEQIIHSLFGCLSERVGWDREVYKAGFEAQRFVSKEYDVHIIQELKNGVLRLVEQDLGVRKGYSSLVFLKRKRVLQRSYEALKPEEKLLRGNASESTRLGIGIAFDSTLPPSYDRRNDIETQEFQPIYQKLCSLLYSGTSARFDELRDVAHQITTPPKEKEVFGCFRRIFDIYFDITQ